MSIGIPYPGPTSNYVQYASKTCVLDANLTTGSGTDDTAALQAILNLATVMGRLEIVLDGPALVSGLLVYSNTIFRFLNGAGLFLKSGSTVPCVMNAHPTKGTITDVNISIINAYINPNRAGQASWVIGDTPISGIALYGVQNFLIQRPYIGGGQLYAIHLANAFDGELLDANISNRVNSAALGNGQDGVHINGPASRVNVSGTFYTADDAVAHNADDGVGDMSITQALGPYVGKGPITNCKVNAVLNNCGFGYRALSQATGAVSVAGVILSGGSISVTCTSTATLVVGMSFFGTSVRGSALIVSILSSTVFLMSTAATGIASGSYTASISQLIDQIDVDLTGSVNNYFAILGPFASDGTQLAIGAGANAGNLGAINIKSDVICGSSQMGANVGGVVVTGNASCLSAEIVRSNWTDNRNFCDILSNATVDITNIDANLYDSVGANPAAMFAVAGTANSVEMKAAWYASGSPTGALLYTVPGGTVNQFSFTGPQIPAGTVHVGGTGGTTVNASGGPLDFPVVVSLDRIDAPQLVGNATLQGVNTLTSERSYFYNTPAALADSFGWTFNARRGTYLVKFVGQSDGARGTCKWQLDGVDVVTGQSWGGTTGDPVVFTNTITISTDGQHSFNCVVTGAGGGSTYFIILQGVQLTRTGN